MFRLERFNETLTPESNKLINIINPGDRHPLCNLRDLLESAQRKCSVSRVSIRSFLEAVIKAANRYAAVVDVLVQPQPVIVTLFGGPLAFWSMLVMIECE